jgi:hypothetical protein
LDISTTRDGEQPGNASEGRLLLTHILSSPSSTLRLPWRAAPTRRALSIPKLPQDVLRTIILYTNLRTYLSLCRVSRLIRSICIANPRVGKYTLLHMVPGSEATFVAHSPGDNALKTISLEWVYYGGWKITEIAPELQRDSSS